MASFLQLAKLAEQMAATPSRLQKRAAIAEELAAIHAAAPETKDAGLFALYLAGTPFAESDPRKLNAGGALLSKAVLAVSGAADADLTDAYRRHGDLGAARLRPAGWAAGSPGGVGAGRDRRGLRRHGHRPHHCRPRSPRRRPPPPCHAH